MHLKNALWYYVEDNVQTHMQKQKKELVKFTQEKAGKLSSSQFQIHIFLLFFSPFLCNTITALRPVNWGVILEISLYMSVELNSLILHKKW